MSAQIHRPLAMVTGASSGIGYHLACIAARNGYDLIVAADQPLEDAVLDFESFGATVHSIQAELASREGIDQLLVLVMDRTVDVVMANAGHGLGGAFLEQDFVDVQHVINTNITGTIYLLQQVGRKMKAQRQGRILVTARSQASSPARSRPSTTAPRPSSIRSWPRCATK